MNHRHADFQSTSISGCSIASDGKSVKQPFGIQTLSGELSNENGDLPVALTGLCHQSSASVEIAAQWISRHRDEIPGFAIPFVRERFGLTSLEAIEALKEGHRLRYAKA